MSSLLPYRRHQTTEFDLEQIQDNIDDAVRQFSDRPSLAASLFEDLTLTAGAENLLEHGLDRAFRGWRIVDINVPAFVFRNTATTSDPVRFLALVPTATCIVSVEVF